MAQQVGRPRSCVPFASDGSDDCQPAHIQMNQVLPPYLSSSITFVPDFQRYYLEFVLLLRAAIRFHVHQRSLPTVALILHY